MLTRKYLWPVFFFILTVGITVYTFNGLVLHPGQVMMGLGGDASKNYYTYIYHIFFGEGTWFKGMNYPSGDHIVYVDAIPLLSVPLGYLHRVIDFDLPHALAVMHLLMAASFLLAIIYTYKILRVSGVARVFALAFAILIMLLSPQVLRMSAHYGLVFFCIVPMLFYWLLSYYHRPRIRYAVYVFFLALAAVFLHPYFIGMSFVFVSFYSFVYFLMSKQSARQRLMHILPLLLSILTVVMVFKLFMFLTDPVKDRPAYPYGITQYNTVGDQLFTSEYSPLWKMVKDKGWYKDVSSGGEGFAYIGITVIVVVGISVVRGILSFTRRKEKTRASSGTFPPVFIFVAFAALLLGMGVPFVWNMEWLVDYISVFKQFRSMGRFTWIFYYIITIYAAVKLYSWYRHRLQGAVTLANSVMIIAISVWAYEASGYVQFIRYTPGSGSYNYRFFSGSLEHTQWPEVLAAHNYRRKDFQGIIALPFFHVGSDKLWINGHSGWLLTLSARASLQTQLAIVDVYAARTSWGQTFDKVRIGAGPLSQPAFFDRLPDNRPFLLLQAEYDSLTYDEKYLLQAADYITDYSQCHVYAFYPHRYKQLNQTYRDSMLRMSSGLPAGDTCLSCPGPWAVNHLDTGNAADKLFGSGAAEAINGDQVICQATLVPQHDSVLYECSLWTLVNAKNYTTPSFALQLLDAAGNVMDEVKVIAGESVDNEGMWFRASKFFYVPKACRKIQTRTLNIVKGTYFALDEIMLRPADATIISKDENGNVLVNNHLLIKK